MENAPANPKNQNRRRNYLINPAFQWKQAGTIALIVFFTSTIVGYATFGILHEQARHRLADPNGFQADVGSVILFFSIGCSALTAGGIGFWSILMTHRICGPAHVLERAMQELCAGRFPVMRGLRKKDELQALYASVSGAVDALKAKTRCELAVISEALDIARNARQATDALRQSSLQTLASQLESVRRDLAESLQPNPATPVSMPALKGVAEPLGEPSATPTTA